MKLNKTKNHERDTYEKVRYVDNYVLRKPSDYLLGSAYILVLRDAPVELADACNLQWCVGDNVAAISRAVPAVRYALEIKQHYSQEKLTAKRRISKKFSSFSFLQNRP